jgi:hypothetical protein
VEVEIEEELVGAAVVEEAAGEAGEKEPFVAANQVDIVAGDITLHLQLVVWTIQYLTHVRSMRAVVNATTATPVDLSMWQ